MTAFRLRGVAPTENAVLGLQRAFQLSPEDPGLRLRVAYQALASDQASQARSVLAPIAFSAHGGTLRDMAAKVIGLIDAGKSTEALQALDTKAKEKD